MNSCRRNVFGLVLFFGLTTFVFAEPPADVAPPTGFQPDVQITQGTRLDWKFPIAGYFDPAAPSDYDSKKQHYQLYVPPNYDASKTWPLLVFISPSDKPVFWNIWKKPCEEMGMLFCEAYGAGNSTSTEHRPRIVLDMLDEIRRNYSIDPDQTYITGFSGGGRLACFLAFALPEYFGGVIPICGTWPLSSYPHLRHRLHDRLSVACVSGTGDFNRGETSQLDQQLQSFGVRSKPWIVEAMAHSVPNPEILGEILKWVAEDLPRRQADRKAYPAFAVAPDEAPTAEQQAARHLEVAQAEAKKPERAWWAFTLAEGIVKRWPETPSAAQAQKLIDEFKNDPERNALVETQRNADPMLPRTQPRMLGVAFEQGTLKIRDVEKESAAELAEMQVGDEILKFDGAKMSSMQELMDAIKKHKVGDQVDIEVRRGDETKTLPVTLGGRAAQDKAPPEKKAATPSAS